MGMAICLALCTSALAGVFYSEGQYVMAHAMSTATTLILLFLLIQMAGLRSSFRRLQRAFIKHVLKGEDNVQLNEMIAAIDPVYKLELQEEANVLEEDVICPPEYARSFVSPVVQDAEFTKDFK